MGNEISEQREHNSERPENRWCSSNEEDERRCRRNNSTNRKSECKSGSHPTRRVNSRDMEVADQFQTCNNIMNFGCGSAHNRLGFGIDGDMNKMMSQTISSRVSVGEYQSTQMFSSVSCVGADGVPVSESRGISTNSNGRCKMAHQRRIGYRSRTLVRQRPNELEEFKEFQSLQQLNHDDIPRFNSEFNHRTKNWSSLDSQPIRTVDDGRRSRTVLSCPHQRSVSNQNYSGPSESYKYRPRGIEY